MCTSICATVLGDMVDQYENFRTTCISICTELYCALNLDMNNPRLVQMTLQRYLLEKPDDIKSLPVPNYIKKEFLPMYKKDIDSYKKRISWKTAKKMVRGFITLFINPPDWLAQKSTSTP